jgi:hypothetical protein
MIKSSAMRVALISDLHGNALALDAVLQDIARVGVDHTVCLGDTATLGPSPTAVLSRLRDLRIPCIEAGGVQVTLRRVSIDKRAMWQAAVASSNPLAPMMAQQYA